MTTTSKSTNFDDFRIIEDVPTILFIDGRNTHNAMYNVLKKRTNFAKLKDYFHYSTRLMKSFYYTPIVIRQPKEGEVPRESPTPGLKKFLNSLENMGYVVGTKKVNSTSYSNVLNTIQFEMTADLMHYVLTNHIKQVILFSSEPAFVPTLNCLRKNGVYINVCTVYKWQQSNTNGGSDDMREHTASRIRHAADNFIELMDVMDSIGCEDIKSSFPVNEDVEEVDLDDIENS